MIHNAPAGERFTFIRQRRDRFSAKLLCRVLVTGGAAAESFSATIKTEIGTEAWPGRATARRGIENWITGYNQRRLHSSLGCRSPVETRIAWRQRMSIAA